MPGYLLSVAWLKCSGVLLGVSTSLYLSGSSATLVSSCMCLPGYLLQQQQQYRQMFSIMNLRSVGWKRKNIIKLTNPWPLSPIVCKLYQHYNQYLSIYELLAIKQNFSFLLPIFFQMQNFSR